MLIIIGTGLSSFSLSMHRNKLIGLIIFKNLLHPIFGYVLARYVFCFDHSLITIITLAASFPSGIQTYYFSSQYNALSDLSSANILLSTFISIFTISIVVFLLHTFISISLKFILLINDLIKVGCENVQIFFSCDFFLYF